MADHVIETKNDDEQNRGDMLTDVEAQINEQDKLLDELSVTVSNIKNQASTISNEIDDQRMKLMELEEDVEHVNTRLTKTKEKIRQIKKELGSYCSDLCILISCIIGLIFIFFVAIPFLIYII